MRDLDLITIGRSSVDLYGAQVGGHLEDMRSFEKYIGGSPTNIAAGAARLGLKAGLITAVGDEHMGRFICDELAANGVDLGGVKVDPERLTALVLLGIRDREQFPLIFYRENCADMGLTDADIDPDYIARSRAVVATGTHLSHPETASAVNKALKLAKNGGAKTALDIDYRPNLWGLAGHGEGEERFIASDRVTDRLLSTLHLFDLIVGTEEEFHIAGGSTDTVEALRAVRAVSDATLVCKRGPMGAVAFNGAISDKLDEGQSGPGFPIEVFNVLGAGDGFMAGLLKGWLEGHDWTTALTYANACGALAVSRHGCAPAYPSWDELQFFLKRGVVDPALRHDRALEQIHWSTNRKGKLPVLRLFDFDRGPEFEIMPEISPENMSAFKQLCLQSCLQAADGRNGYGILTDGQSGQSALFQAVDHNLWIGRSVKEMGSEIGSDMGELTAWPARHVVTCKITAYPNSENSLWEEQLRVIERLFIAGRRNRLELLLELVPPQGALMGEVASADAIKRIYRAGVFPDWWMVGPQSTVTAWSAVANAIDEKDQHTRGILLRIEDGLEASNAAMSLAARVPLVKGFATRPAISSDLAKRWAQGEVDDSVAIAFLANNFQEFCHAWDQACAAAKESER